MWIDYGFLGYISLTIYLCLYFKVFHLDLTWTILKINERKERSPNLGHWVNSSRLFWASCLFKWWSCSLNLTKVRAIVTSCLKIYWYALKVNKQLNSTTREHAYDGIIIIINSDTSMWRESRTIFKSLITCDNYYYGNNWELCTFFGTGTMHDVFHKIQQLHIKCIKV